LKESYSFFFWRGTSFPFSYVLILLKKKVSRSFLFFFPVCIIFFFFSYNSFFFECCNLISKGSELILFSFLVGGFFFRGFRDMFRVSQHNEVAPVGTAIVMGLLGVLGRFLS